MHTIVLFSEKAGVNRPLIETLTSLFPESRIKIVIGQNRPAIFDGTALGGNPSFCSAAARDNPENIE